VFLKTFVHSVSQCFFVLCDIKYILKCFFFVPQCLTVTLCRTLWYSVTLNYSAAFLFLFHSVSQCFHSVSQFFLLLSVTFLFHSVSQCFFCTLCYSVLYSVVLCDIKLFRSVSFLFHSVSQCFHGVSQCFFALCVTLCRTLWYNIFHTKVPIF